jgi:hypothetical protein
VGIFLSLCFVVGWVERSIERNRRLSKRMIGLFEWVVRVLSGMVCAFVGDFADRCMCLCECVRAC